jgi:hypothetical protein
LPLGAGAFSPGEAWLAAGDPAPPKGGNSCAAGASNASPRTSASVGGASKASPRVPASAASERSLSHRRAGHAGRAPGKRVSSLRRAPATLTMTVSDPSLSPCASPRAQRVGCKEARSPSCAAGEPPIASCGLSSTVRVSGKVESSRRCTASTLSLAPCGARCPERVGETAARSDLHAAGASHGMLRARPMTVSAAIIALGAPPRALGATTIAAHRTRRLARQRRARREKRRHTPYKGKSPARSRPFAPRCSTARAMNGHVARANSIVARDSRRGRQGIGPVVIGNRRLCSAN